MPSTPESTALADYLKVSKSRARLIQPPPIQTDATDEDGRDAMRGRCRDSLSCADEGWPTDALFQLRKVVELAVHLGMADQNEWLLLQEVFEATGGLPRCKAPSEAAAWGRALDFAVESLNKNVYRKAMLPSSREEMVAQTLLSLRSKGYSFTIDGYGARLKRRSYLRLCDRIEDKIKRVGGLRAANALLGVMVRTQRVEDGSLLHARTPTMVTNRVPRSGTPWHFIYNLCLKHLLSPPSVADVEAVLTAMEELARELAASINVEPYNAYENMHLSNYGISGAVHETIVYDELFGFPQWQPQASKIVLPLWLDALTETGCSFPAFEPNQWRSGATALLERAAVANLNPIAPIDLASRVLSTADAATMLELLTSPSLQLNAGYRTPSDTPARHGSWYPTLRTGAQNYYAQPRAVLTRAFAERLYALMRADGVPNLENRMGQALELLTVKALAHFGIVPTITNGFYTVDASSQLFEVDIAVETDDRIFLIECTKKPLTSAARGGSTVASLRDLEGSFLKLIQQLARHEAHLRTRGRIQFEDGRTLELRGRHIEKIGINLFDHGSLQNRDFTIALIERLAGASMASEAPEAQDVVRAMNRRLASLNESVSDIIENQRDIEDRGLFHFAISTWWLSIDQFVYLLLQGGGDLWTNIKIIRHMTARSGDLMHELRRSRELNEVGSAMVHFAQQTNSRAMI